MKLRNLVAAPICASALLAGGSASAQSTAEEPWRFQAIVYGYLPDIGGNTTFSRTGGGSSVEVDASTILKNLNGVFMGMFEMSKGRWGVYTDLMYMDVGNDKSGTRDIAIGGTQIPADVSAGVDFNLKGWIWTIAGEYQVVQDPRAPFFVLAGARLLDMDQTLSYQLSGNVGRFPVVDRQGNLDASLTNWDAIVGVKGRVAFGNDGEWFVPYYFDIGTGQSDLTWQAIGGIGYSFKWGDVIAAWRYLDYNMKSGSKVESLNFNGPAIGLAFRW